VGGGDGYISGVDVKHIQLQKSRDLYEKKNKIRIIKQLLAHIFGLLLEHHKDKIKYTLSFYPCAYW